MFQGQPLKIQTQYKNHFVFIRILSSGCCPILDTDRDGPLLLVTEGISAVSPNFLHCYSQGD